MFAPTECSRVGKTRSEMSIVNEIISLTKNDSRIAAALPRPGEQCSPLRRGEGYSFLIS